MNYYYSNNNDDGHGTHTLPIVEGFSEKGAQTAAYIVDLAEELFAEYLPDYNVDLRFGRGVKLSGSTSWERVDAFESKIVIRISKMFLEDCDQAFNENTLRHEIAHALAGPSHGHDRTWKSLAVKLGAEPTPYHKALLKNRQKYRAVCPHCGHKSYMSRKPKLKRSCGTCSHGRYNDKYLLVYVDNPERITT